MGFAAEFSQWLQGILENFIGRYLEIMGEALAPVIVTLATLYLMGLGFLLMTGRIETPLLEVFKRIAVIAAILGVCLHLWLYQPLIVNTFFYAPGELAARFVGAFEPVSIVDQIIFSGGDIAALLIAKGGLFNGDIAYYLMGFIVYVVVAGTAIYTLFLLTLSRVALAVLLALGPLFLTLLFFKSTTRLCEAWLAQLSNYALIAILTVLIAALMLHVLGTEATRAIEQGGEIQIADAMRVGVAAGLTCLIMRQVLPLASSLSSGVALQSYAMLSRVVMWSAESISRHRARSRWESQWAKRSPPQTQNRLRPAAPSTAPTVRRRNVIRAIDDPKAMGIEP